MLKRGYNAFSFSDISKPLGIKNAAIHYYYPTKEKLGIDILRKEQELFKNWKVSPGFNKLGFEMSLKL
ncbi:MAG: helix-turn-helix domain-containing protein, partial [Bacteroidota bacterium]